MSERTGHGNGAGTRRLEILPIVELPVGVPGVRHAVDSDKARQLRERLAATRASLAAARTGGDGRVTKGAVASLLGRLGGYQRALGHELARLEAEQHRAMSALASELLPGLVATDPDFAAGLPLAVEFTDAETESLTEDVAGGELPDGPKTMLMSAALQTVASRVLFARGDFKTASMLANDARQNIAAAHEYAVKRAQARRAGQTARNGGRPPIASRFLVGGKP
jgi:hypothetical protein